MAEADCPGCKTTDPGEECPNCGTIVDVGEDNFECPNCSNIIASDTEVCPHCGTEFEWLDEYEEDTGLECPDCGTTLHDDDALCPGCGAEIEFLDEEEEAPLPTAVPEKKGLLGKRSKEKPSKDKGKDKPPKDKDKEKPPKEKRSKKGGEKVQEEKTDEVGPIEPTPMPRKESVADPDADPLLDENMDLDAEIERIEEEESLQALAEEEPLTAEQVEEMFERSLEEMGNPYDVKNPTSDYTAVMMPVERKLALAQRLGAVTDEADRLLDNTYMLAKQREFPAALRNAKDAEAELDRQIEDTVFHRQYELREATRHLGEEGAAEVSGLLQQAMQKQASGDMAAATDFLEKASVRVAEERPEFSQAEEMCRGLSRRVAAAERFLVDTRQARDLMAHSRDHARRGDWVAAMQVCEGAISRLDPVLRRVAEQELDSVKALMVELKRRNQVTDAMLAAAKDAKEFMEKGEPLPALEHLFRLKREAPRDA